MFLFFSQEMAPVDKKLLMRQHRQRLKADKQKWDQHLLKEKQRDQQRRTARKALENDDDRLKEARRKQVLERVRKHRKKLKETLEDTAKKTRPWAATNAHNR